MRWYVDSNGAIHEELNNLVSNRKNVLKRAMELSTAWGAILEAQGNADMKSYFDYMIEVSGDRENVLFFTKTPIPASDEIVKKANLAASQSDYKYMNDNEKYVLNSIYSTKENGKTKWWLISAEKICLQRNSYDDKYIRIRHIITPYASFKDVLDDIIVTKAEAEKMNSQEKFVFPLNKWQFVSGSNRDYHDLSKVITHCFEKDDSFKKSFKIFQNELVNRYSLREVDPYSNVKNNYLTKVYTKIDKIYPSYVIIKNHLKKSHKDLWFVNYKQNLIVFCDSSQNRERIIVSGTHEEPIFLINGNEYHSINKLMQALDDKSCFEKPNWYESIEECVASYVKSCYKMNQPKYKIKKPDWLKKNKKTKPIFDEGVIGKSK